MNISENSLSKIILETVPQAFDPEHLLHKGLWQIIVNSGVKLSEDELSELLSVLRVRANKNETDGDSSQCLLIVKE